MPALGPGATLGPYKILEAIGAGGMGTVYKARDTRLNRVVAIKVAQAEFTDRFAREARSIAALNHPNICQLYDVGPNYLVMEFVEGAPIAAPDSPRKLLDYAMQIADGMAAAHAAGLVHRDLKPDNILVTREGRVKILDFGLAKAVVQQRPDDATRTIGITDPGTTIGTVAYMSPEQARGEQSLGPQSDQFSLGLILYEMAAGKRAFTRASFAETMTAIIREEPEPLPASTPAPLKWVIARLLSKDASDRYDSSRDLYRELKHARERQSESVPAAASSVRAPKRQWLAWAMLGVGLAGGVAVSWLLTSRSAGPAVSNLKFTPLSRDEATEREPAWSPDGKTLAYSASVEGRLQIFTREIGSGEAAQITRGNQSATRPFWSPDGRTVYFQSEDAIWAVSATGGSAEKIIDQAVPGAVLPDGKTFFFFRDIRAFVGSPDGDVRQLPLPSEIYSAGRPVFVGSSPDGKRVALAAASGLWIVPYDSGEPVHYAIEGIGGGDWMPDNRRLLLVRREGDGSRMVMLDARDGSTRPIYSSPSPALTPTVSPDGKKIAYVEGRAEWNLMEISVPEGRVSTLLAGGGVAWYPAWAPSGTHYLFATNRSGKWAIDDASVTEGFSRRLVEVPEALALRNVSWAPDGARFTFQLNREERETTMLANATGGRIAPLDPNAPGPTAEAVWSPDGQWIVYLRPIPPAATGAVPTAHIAKIRPGSSGEPEILATYSIAKRNEWREPLAWSPTGEWIAAHSLSGLYLMSPDYKNERKISSRSFGDRVAFSKDGRQVFGLFRNSGREGAQWQLFAMDVATGAEKMIAGIDLPVTTDDARGLSLHPDGKRLATSIAKWPFDIWMIEGFE